MIPFRDCCNTMQQSPFYGDRKKGSKKASDIAPMPLKILFNHELFGHNRFYSSHLM